MEDDKPEWSCAVVGQALIKRDLRMHYAHPSCREVCDRIRSADVAFTNLETAIVGAYGGWPTKEDAVSASRPDVLDSLQAAGFGLLSLANNHTFDLGPGGILSAMDEAQQRGFLIAGAGRNRTEAAKPGIARIGKRKAALVAMDCGKQPDYAFALDAVGSVPSRPGVNRQRVHEINGVWTADEADWQRHAAAIREAVREADTVIVYLHNHFWETDPESTSPWIRDYARRCVDLGAHLVVAHGVPLLQGMELYRRRPLFYGLGNFIFHSAMPGTWRRRMGRKPWESVIAHCRFDGNGELTRLDVTPIYAGGDAEELESRSYTHLDAPRMAHGGEAADIVARFVRLSQTFGTAFISAGESATARLE